MSMHVWFVIVRAKDYVNGYYVYRWRVKYKYEIFVIVDVESGGVERFYQDKLTLSSIGEELSVKPKKKKPKWEKV